MIQSGGVRSRRATPVRKKLLHLISSRQSNSSYIFEKAGEAEANVIADDQDVTTGLMAYLRQAPNLARYYNVGLDPKGQPNPDDVAQTAKNRVIIRARKIS
jgi:hypothetical protein